MLVVNRYDSRTTITHLKVANLHRCWAAQDIRRCPHQPRRLDLSPGLDDLGFSSSLALSRHT